MTREAVRKSRKLINRVRRESPYGKLVVSGCAVSTGEAGDATDLGVVGSEMCIRASDRLVAILGGQETIRDFIAFPKNNSGRDVMIDAPSPIDNEQLKELPHLG